jgi:hypothetical protein
MFSLLRYLTSFQFVTLTIRFVEASPSKLVLQFSYIYMPQDQGRQHNFMSHITLINFKGVGRGCILGQIM